MDSKFFNGKNCLKKLLMYALFILYLTIWERFIIRNWLTWVWDLRYAKSLQSCWTLCHPMDRSPSGSSVHEILQARILEWVAMPSSRGSLQPRDWTSSLMSPALAGGFFTTSTIWEKSAGLESWRPRTASGAVTIHQQFAGEFPLAGEAIFFLLFCSGLQLIGWGPSTSWRTILHYPNSLI